MLLTTARRDAGGNRGDFVIDGDEMADHRRGRRQVRDHHGAATRATPLGPAGATMFLAPMDAPGIHIERVLDTLDQYMAGGHAVVRLDGLRVPESAVLGRVGEGFRYAQARLAPARLTHCMRWLGAARRAHDIADRLRPPPHRLRQAARRARGGRLHARRQRDGHPHRAAWRSGTPPGCSTKASAAATN